MEEESNVLFELFPDTERQYVMFTLHHYSGHGHELSLHELQHLRQVHRLHPQHTGLHYALHSGLPLWTLPSQPGKVKLFIGSTFSKFHLYTFHPLDKLEMFILNKCIFVILCFSSDNYFYVQILVVSMCDVGKKHFAIQIFEEVNYLLKWKNIK